MSLTLQAMSMTMTDIPKRLRAAALAACLALAGCDGVFDYHPYDVRISGETDINRRAIERIEAATAGRDTLRVAFVSDSHGWYSATDDMVADINARGGVDFPYVALIGNHDCLGTGEELFRRVYGEPNFSFIAGRVKFVCLNTNATEYDYVAANPDFDYMEAEMTADSAHFDRTIVCMHAAPYSDQFNNNVAKPFQLYVRAFPGLLFCIYGHDHRQAASDPFGDGVMYYGVDCADHRNYMLFTITPDGYDHETVSY